MGVTINLKSNDFIDIASEYYKVHNSMQAFWDQYSTGGKLSNIMPNIKEYNKALYNLLIVSGKSKDAAYATLAAFNQQKSYGLSTFIDVPRLPNRINQKNNNQQEY